MNSNTLIQDCTGPLLNISIIEFKNIKFTIPERRFKHKSQDKNRDLTFIYTNINRPTQCKLQMKLEYRN